MEIQRIRHASFRIVTDRGVQVYLDPWQLPEGLPPADVVAITHDHHDHCSAPDVRKLWKAGTVLLGPAAVQARLAGEGLAVQLVQVGQQLDVMGVRLRAVEAYTVSKFRPSGEPTHPREKGYVGYLLEADGRRVYFAGDTDVVPPEVDAAGPVDVALVPVSGTFVMTAEEAAAQLAGRAVRRAVPMHYGAHVGTAQDAERFRQMAPCPVTVLADGESLQL